MMPTASVSPRTWQRRDPRTQLFIWASWVAAVAVFVGCFQLISGKTIWAFVWDAPQQAGDLAVRMVPPDWLYIRALGRPIWDTINIATIGTLVAQFFWLFRWLTVPRVIPSPSVSILRPIALFIIVSSRSINALSGRSCWSRLLAPACSPALLRSRCARSVSAPSCFTRPSRK